jgi:putative FmdB family regulatory protein
MPLYEFRCESCGARFEALAPVGTQSAGCPKCESERTVRVFSAPAPPQHLVKTRSEARKQEARNAALQSSARSRFKEARRKARERRGGGSPPGAG